MMASVHVILDHSSIFVLITGLCVMLLSQIGPYDFTRIVLKYFVQYNQLPRDQKETGCCVSESVSKS